MQQVQQGLSAARFTIKRIGTFIIGLFIPVLCLAQVNGFSVNDGKAIWQNVFETNLSIDQLGKGVLQNGRFNDICVIDSTITCRLNTTKIDVEPMGYSIGSVPMYVLKEFTCFATIQIREGRYRVTVEQMTVSISMNALRYENKSTDYPIETWAVKNGQLSKAFVKSPSNIYNRFFLEVFNFTPKTYISEQW